MALKLVFMGTPDFAVPVLDAVHEAGHEVVAVYSQPPRPAGRGLAEKKSPVHQRAEALGLPVLTPQNFRDASVQEAFRQHGADAAVVVAYGLLLPEEVLGAPRLGCYNVHASKLPRWRGAAPIQRAIMAGDAVTGVAIMRMEKGLDTGPVGLSRDLPIGPMTTAGELHDRLSEAGAGLMVEALAALEDGRLRLESQPSDGVTYAKKIEKHEAEIDFRRPASEIARQVHGLSPFPGAWFVIGEGKTAERIKVLACEVTDHSGAPGMLLDDRFTIACGDGAIRPVTVQRAGKKPVSRAEFLRGFPLPADGRIATPTR